MTNITFIHAHPDDETIATGALIAHLIEEGHAVSVLTATRGEMGGVVAGRLSHLAGTPALEAHRERELDGALAVLGVSEHAFLGDPPARDALGARRYRDSGMVWLSDGVAGPGEEADEASLTSADEDDIVADLIAWLRHVRAELVITYDADGGYGHPDHVKCHHVSRTASDILGLDFAVVVPEPGDDVVWFDLDHLLPVVARALGHHESQVTVEGSTLTHSGGQSEPVRTSVGLRGQTRKVMS